MQGKIIKNISNDVIKFNLNSDSNKHNTKAMRR